MVELVDEIPTGNTVVSALEVTSIVVEPPATDGAEPGELPALPPLALGAPAGAPPSCRGEAPPYDDPADHLSALLDLVTARVGLALATRWQAVGDLAERHPAEREVRALAGITGDGAAALAEAGRRIADQAHRIAARAIASVARGAVLPVVALAGELRLSLAAVELIVAALAPCARGEIRRLYRMLAGDGRRAICDDALVTTFLADGDPRRLDALYAELAADAPLARHGLMSRDARGGLELDPVAVARLRGWPIPASAATVIRAADRQLDELAVDRAALRALMLELAAPRDLEAPARVVIRGRRGSGRHATLAALAALVDRRIACIDASLLPRGAARASALRRELARAAIAGAIPVVSGLELRRAVDPDVASAIAQVVRAHPGPLVVRTSPSALLPVAPGGFELELPALAEPARQRAFAAALDREAVAASPELVAARHRVGPGTLARAARVARRWLDASDADPVAALDAALRAELAGSVGGAAVEVAARATWDDLVLGELTQDGVRTVIGTARYGAAQRAIALFHGPPGTGKTMAASVIAGELGRPLYRVDLVALRAGHRDPERALDAVFDAAHDAGWVIVLDDADRAVTGDGCGPGLDAGELGRRLAAFDGVAIVEARAGREIAALLGRALGLRLGFALPDEAQRARLWAAHVPAGLARDGGLDFAALARVPLSGGQVRRAARRAWILASEERSPLTQHHLERAAALAVHDPVGA
jgi:ATPase family associated with various cellular activities (AAA)